MKRIVSILLFELCCLLWAGTGWSQQFDDSFPVVGPPNEGRHKADAIDLGKPDSTFYFVDARDSREYSNDAGGRACDIYYKLEVERPMDIIIHNFRSKIQATRTHLYKIRELEDYEIPEGELCPEIACSDEVNLDMVDELCSRYIDEMPEFRYGGNNRGLLCMKRLEKGTYYVMSEGDEYYCIDSDCNGIIVTTIRGFAAEGNHSDYPIFAGIYGQDFNYEDDRDPWYYYSERGNKTIVHYAFTLRHAMDITISQKWSDSIGGKVFLESDKISVEFYEDTLSLQLLPGNYQIELNSNSFSAPCLCISGRMSDYSEPWENLPPGLTETCNYIYSIRPTIETSSVAEMASGQAIYTVRYFDGLGRPSQVVDRGSSPLQKDILRFQEYDLQGREARKWLPVVSTGDGGYVAKDYFTHFSRSFYSGDSCAYSYPVYEDSPLNRVTEHYGEGGEWHEKGKSVKTDYRLNMLEDSLLNCLRFRITEVSDTLFAIDNCGNYEPGALHVECKSDEDGNVSCFFTDHAGQTVLRRELPGNSVPSTYCDTYFIYDGNGHLQAVLPPAAIDKMQATGSYSSACLEQYAYFYRYDRRNRCIAKKLPGSRWEYFVYDDADHLILSQDGNLRLCGEWKFSLSDAMGRVVLTGVCRNEVADVSTFLCGVVAEAVYSPYNTDTTFGGYSIHGVTLSSPVLHSVYYYDGYAFLGQNGFPFYAYDESLEVEGYGAWYGDSCSVYSHKGLQTGSISFPLEAHAPALYSVSYYDKYRRCIQTHSSHLLDGCDSEYLSYDFAGKLLKRLHLQTASGAAPQSELYTYRYDHAGRLLETRHRLNDGLEVSLSECCYDAIGRLVFDKKHANDLLQTEYLYNVRSWPKSVSSPLFNQTLYYMDGAGTPCYNGNVSSMTWGTGSSPIRGYKFTYDGLSRMTDAVYGEGNALTQHPNRFNEQVSGYDKMGNILGLFRYGQTSTGGYGLVDNLNFVYDGNQLQSVYDNAILSAAATGMEFVDGIDLPIEYTYDANGNLTKDLNKKIVDIQYNCLNLPTCVIFANGNSISYLYDANGTKIRTTHVIGNDTTITDYCGNVVYENGVPKTLLTEAGFVSLNDRIYHYYLKDHQGNNRVVADQNGTIEEVNHYYPFGSIFTSASSVQSYKYNGKELDRNDGLDWYDYGARQYAPAIGRWNAVDPSSEKHYNWSPYSYCKNNPVLRVDIDGKDDYTVNSAGRLFKTVVEGSTNDRLMSIRSGVESITVNDKKILSGMYNMQDGKSGGLETYNSTSNLEDAATVFKFGADNTSVEWKLDIYNDKGDKTAIIGTSGREDSVFSDKQSELNVKGDKVIDMHSHPYNAHASGQDMKNLKIKTGTVYHRDSKVLFFYNSENSRIGNNEYKIDTSKTLLDKLNDKFMK